MEPPSSTQGNRPAPVRKRKSGVIIPHKARWQQHVAAALVWAVIRIISATVRYRFNDENGMVKAASEGKIIFAIWHNRLALSLMLYRRFIARPGSERRLAAMVSASRDGGFLARILELFGVEPVRGSSSRRGPQALREMVTAAESGFDVAITPDGPRGPCYQVQEGVISTAQLTGLPILPVSYHLNWKICSKGWDRFQIPLPFARCEVRVAPLIHVPREASDAEREALRKKLETELRRISED